MISSPDKVGDQTLKKVLRVIREISKTQWRSSSTGRKGKDNNRQSSTKIRPCTQIWHQTI